MSNADLDHEHLAVRRAAFDNVERNARRIIFWACAAGSCGASGRGRDHRCVSAAWIEPWRARPVPFGATASCQIRRRTLARSAPRLARVRAARSTTWCITAALGVMPKRSSGTSTVPALALVGDFMLELHAVLLIRRRALLHCVAHEDEPAAGRDAILHQDQILACSASPWTTSRLRVVTRMSPIWPVIFMPLNTGQAWCTRRWSRATGASCGSWLRPALEVVSLHRAGEVLALADRGDVDAVAASKRSRRAPDPLRTPRGRRRAARRDASPAARRPS